MGYWSRNHSHKAVEEGEADRIKMVFHTEKINMEEADKIINKTREIFPDVPPSSAIAWIKILANAFCTRARFGQTPRECVFGCKGHYDHMAHYLMCPTLYCALDSTFKIGVGVEDFGDWLLHLDKLTMQTSIVAIGVADCVQFAYNAASADPRLKIPETIAARRKFITLRSTQMNNAINDHIRGIVWKDTKASKRKRTS